MPDESPNIQLADWEPIALLAQRVGDGTQTARELVTKSLDAIAAAETYNTVITVAAESALRRADEIDQAVKSGQPVGRLAGVPFIAKDNYLTKGIQTTAASNILKGYIPPISATVIEKLEAEGAILVAKSNLDAFAHGASTENSDFGATLNPYDTQRVAGGSSGGSAAAVALGLAPFAIGSDTGGSIRQPASFCGVVGVKPTYGLVSRYGVVAMASSTDVMGPLTRTVADAALVFDCMAGPDNKDSTTIDRDTSYVVQRQRNLTGLKVGVLKEYVGEGVDTGVAETVMAVVEKLKRAGVSVSEISVPSVSSAIAVYYIVVPAEVSSNLSRYDGIRYATSVRTTQELNDVYELTRAAGFNPENKRRIMIGTYVLSSGYYDAYYKKAQTVRTKLINDFAKAFSQVDIMIGPTAPTTAFKVGENTDDPVKMYLSDVMTVAANLVGTPAINIRGGFSQGLPVGVQLMADQRRDADLLQFAYWVEGLV